MKTSIITFITASLLFSAVLAIKFITFDEIDLFKANIEALADGEGISAFVNCAGEGGIYCPLDNQAIYREVTIEQIKP